MLGFDCEWVLDQYGVRQNVALLQLATHRGLCVLIRLCEFGKIPSELQVKSLVQSVGLSVNRILTMTLKALILMDFSSNFYRNY